ncbi:MAG: glycosyltransferase [Luteitalea sp.]|nr:glycosyltransferase [Luteitalea sp.]
MRIVFIVQRYGTEVLGGSEQLCRLVAERMAAQHEVEVLTTCALDYVTWTNEYPEGSDRVRGVTVRRFANARTRDVDSFNSYSDWIYHHPHSRNDELEWLKQQGPWCPALIEFLRRHHQHYDVLVFFTYLYAPTVLGLEVAPARSVLVPTAHDEPAIRLELFKEVFSRPAAICYLTESEKRFVESQFPDRPLLEAVTGVGVDVPPQNRYPPTFEAGTDETDARSDDDPGASASSDGEAQAGGLAPHLLARGSVFRRRHRLHGALALYGGRIDPGKGCEELIQYFGSYVKQGGIATLALMGVKLMALPEDPAIRFAGLLSDTERMQALEAATVVICPSPFESLSLLALEALSVGTPVIANARSAVLVEHCVRSNGGLWYADRDEFVECLMVLVGDAQLRAALGRNGQEYVRNNYRWDVVLGKYERIFTALKNAR